MPSIQEKLESRALKAPAAPLKLAELADAAMSQAERGGRNKVVFSEQA